jgi:hypothetical protein
VCRVGQDADGGGDADRHAGHFDNGGRHETPEERYDRNWVELLQELRVTQTGTQIISGFLLTLAFQQRFIELDDFQVTTYVVLVLLAAASTALGLAPVGLHRALFGRHEKQRIVRIANVLLRTTLAVVAVLTAGVVLFILDFTIGRAAGIVASAGTLLFLGYVLVVLPRLGRESHRQPKDEL